MNRKRVFSMFLTLVLLCGVLSAAQGETASVLLGDDRYETSEQTVIVTVSTEAVNNVKEAMFGANAMYRQGGYGIMNEATGEFNAKALDTFEMSGITNVRYPGGTEGDFFHWKETIGPLDARIPQINPWSHPLTSGLNGAPYDVVFGAEEWLEFCRLTDSSITMQLNVGTGTAEEAVEWIRYCLESGVKIESIVVGNEAHMEEERVEGIRVTRTPEEYIVFYNEVLEVMGSELLNTLHEKGISFGCIGLPASHALNIHRKWDEQVLSGINVPADVVDLHIGYSPFGVNLDMATNEKIYKCLLASADWVRNLLNMEIKTITANSPDTKILITEYAPHGGSMVYGTAGAMYLASYMQVTLAEPYVIGMDYVFSFMPNQESPICWDAANGEYYITLLGKVFGLYASQTGRQVLDVTVENSKTFNSSAVGLMPRIKNVNEGAVAVYYDPVAGEGSLFVLNRAYDQNTLFDIALPFANARITTVTEMWNEDYGKCNSNSDPEAVGLSVLENEGCVITDGKLTVSAKPVSLVKIDFVISE